MDKKTAITLATLILCISQIFGQTGLIKQAIAGSEVSTGEIINLYSNGLVLFNQKRGGSRMFFYNTELEKNGEIKINSKSKLFNKVSFYYDTSLEKIVVFNPSNHEKRMLLVGLDKSVITLKLKKPFMVKNLFPPLIKTGSKIFCVGGRLNQRTLCTIDLNSGIVTPLKLPVEWDSRFIFTLKQINNKYLSVFYWDRNNDFKNIAILDNEGNLVVDKLITNGKDDYPIQECSIVDMGNNELAVAGTYSVHSIDDYSIGMFIAKIENLKLNYIKYYPYSSINCFNDHLSKNGKEWMEKKENFLAKFGIAYKYLAITHPVVKFNGKFVIAAEFYYPVYSTNTSYSNGKTTTSTDFDGYNFTHTVFLGIDELGNKNFEECFKFKFSSYPKILNNQLRREIDSVEINYSYVTNNAVQSFALLPNGKTKINTAMELKILFEIEKSKNYYTPASTVSGSWYDNYYYLTTGIISQNKGLIKHEKIDYLLLKYKLND